jgi:tetratricopeptide (TPR) repeat protein
MGRRAIAAALLIAGCTAPPPSAYSNVGGAHGPGAVALGDNAAGEACTQTENEPGRGYAIYCGNWKQPSANLQRGNPADATQLGGLATGSPWRQHIDTFLECGAPSPTTILQSPAVVLRCTRRLEGFPQTAFVAIVDGRAWFADGVPVANPVMERALALNAGRIAAGSLGVVTESPGLAAERLARRAVSSNDMAAYGDLRRNAVRANLAGDYAAAEVAYRGMATLQRRVLSADNPAIAGAMAPQALQISNQGRYAEASAMLARAERLAARDSSSGIGEAMVWHYEGLHLLNQGRAPEALVQLKRAEAAYLVLAPDSGAARVPGDALIPPDMTTRAAVFGVSETRRAQALAYRMLGQTAESQARTEAAERVLAAYGLRNTEANARLARTEAVVLLAAGRSDAALSKMRAAANDFSRALPGSRTY